MITAESAEIEAVKVQLEAILEEQGKQISELQQRMNEDTLHSKVLEGQLATERKMWKKKEKLFSNKVKQLENELSDMKNIMQHEANPEKVLLGKLNKDVAQKEQLITSLKNSLGKERSRNKELEQKLLEMHQQQQQQQQGIMLPERGNGKTRKDSMKGNVAQRGKMEKQIGRAITSSGETVKLEVTPVETAEDDDQYDVVSMLFSLLPDSEESGSSPSLEATRRLAYPECCHCRKILVDHVVFPCCHGYCLQCVQVFVSEDFKNGEEFAWCRICEDRFTTPLQNCLQIRLEVKRSVRNLAMNRKRPCEHCMSQRSRDIMDAEFFCIQCERSLCSECSHEHIKHSLSISLHLMLAIRSPIFRSELLDPELYLCSKHPGKPLDFYCDRCKHLVCLNCFSDHINHTLSGIDDYSNAKKEKMKAVLSDMKENILYLFRISDGFRKLQKDYHYHNKIWRIQGKILENVDVMKYWLKKQAEALNRELDFIIKLNDDGVKCIQDDLKHCLNELQQFSLYAEEFIGGAMPGHMACFGEDLCKRARELADYAIAKKSYFENLGVSKGKQVFHPVSFSFAPNEPKLQSDTRRLVGELKIKTVRGWADVQLNSKLIGTIKPDMLNIVEKEVVGLTTLADELFIATRDNSSVEVYDLMTFKRKHYLSGKTNISDIAACAGSNCIYIYGCKGEFKGLLKYQLRGELDAQEMLAMVYDSGRLSITDECNIVVTGCNTNRLSEHTAYGALSLELRLEPESGVFHLWHALKTRSGQFVVSHGVVSDAVQGVCVVDRDGMVLRSYEGNCKARLDTPMYLASGPRGCIMVSDLNNKRVLQLNAILEFNEELISNDEGLQWPCRIHFDVITGRLFVANSTFLENWEVLVFDTK